MKLENESVKKLLKQHDSDNNERTRLKPVDKHVQQKRQLRKLVFNENLLLPLERRTRGDEHLLMGQHDLRAQDQLSISLPMQEEDRDGGERKLSRLLVVERQLLLLPQQPYRLV